MLKIVKIPNPILNKKTAAIKKFDAALVKLAEDMIATCKSVSGIGLAAPQIGKSIRMCIIDLEHMGLPPFALVNPKIVKRSVKKVEMEEGCLSIPGIFGIVQRPEKITVQTMSLDGKKMKLDASGMLARVIQHEVDHLDGILFTSKMIRQTSGKPNEKF